MQDSGEHSGDFWEITVMLIVAQLVNALQLGSIYALVALGYSMVYGIIKLLNFAHGDIIMVGGYVALLTLAAGLPPAFAIMVVIIGCTALAVIMEKLAYTPLRNPTRISVFVTAIVLAGGLIILFALAFELSWILTAILTVVVCTVIAFVMLKLDYAPRGNAPRISVLITAIGLSLFLQNTAQYVFGTTLQPLHIPFPTGNLEIGGILLSYPMLITIGLSLFSMAALNFIVQKTRLGKAMRAVSEDMEAAQLMGINVNSIVTFTFAVGASLAGIGAILYFVRFPVVIPTVGALLGLKAFVAAVLGGIGSIPGAMLGGFAIGFLEVIVTAVGLSRWADGAVFLVLIVVLLVRPSGLMGQPMIEKV